MNSIPRNDPSADLLGDVSRRDFIKTGVVSGAVAAGGLGAFYFGYSATLNRPVRVGVIGTGDEGSVLMGAITPAFLQVRAIADIRPYNVWRAFYGDWSSDGTLEVRPGLLKRYGWRNESEARKQVKVYGPWQDLIANAKADGIEGVIIALPLHLHAPVAIAAMQAGLHVITEKLMGQTVHACKEMARVSASTGKLLATGHQRHYNILYARATDKLRRGELGDLHYIRAQWHRSNLPVKDSWKMPLPPEVKLVAEGKDKGKDLEPETVALLKQRKTVKEDLDEARGKDIDKLRMRLAQLDAQCADKILHLEEKDSQRLAEKYGYVARKIEFPGAKAYDCPAIEELIRWRLFDRTGAGLMAELGSHQLDAASIFVAAAHGGEKQIPLSVSALANRPLFPNDRDVEDHVYCLIEFPAPGYDARDPQASQKRIGVQYASINGNGFGGYGEIVYGTKGTLILTQEKESTFVASSSAATSTKVAAAAGPTLDTTASGPQGPAVKAAAEKISRGYTEELEHWAWCIRNPAKENQPRCTPKVAMGDAIIALVTNMSAREGRRIEFKKDWFDSDSDATPEGVAPDVTRYGKA